MELNDWKCPCGEINFKRRNTCRKCNNAKSTSHPTIEKRLGDWICPNSTCGELNFASRNNCRKCNNEKSTGIFSLPATGLFSGTKPIIEKRSGDWTCPNTACNEHNFQFRDICRKCNTPKITQHKEEENIVDTDNEIDNEMNLCVVCLDQEKTHAITKCGHLCYCGLCGFNINKCPICRETYNPDTDLLKIFSI